MVSKYSYQHGRCVAFIRYNREFVECARSKNVYNNYYFIINMSIKKGMRCVALRDTFSNASMSRLPMVWSPSCLLWLWMVSLAGYNVLKPFYRILFRSLTLRRERPRFRSLVKSVVLGAYFDTSRKTVFVFRPQLSASAFSRTGSGGDGMFGPDVCSYVDQGICTYRFCVHTVDIIFSDTRIYRKKETYTAWKVNIDWRCIRTCRYNVVYNISD